jgi:MFS family permease
VGVKSIQRVLAASAIIASTAALIALARNLVPDLQSPATHAIIFVLLGFAIQGVVNGNAVYVVNAASDEERPYCVAVSSFVAGIVGVLLALLAGSISQQRGIIWALMIMAALNIVAALYARTLPDPADVGRT